MKANERAPLSKAHRKILETLVMYVHRKHCQPSYAELAELCELSSVQRQIDRIGACGWIRITGTPRAIEIPDDVYSAIVDKRTRKGKKK